MTEPTITKQMLIDADACSDQVDLFAQTFGESVTVTAKRAEEVAHLFGWTWAVRLLDAPARNEYYRATENTKAEYDRVIAPAQAKYRHFVEASSSETTTTTPELAEYLHAVETAWVRCRIHATAPAWAAAFINMHKRGASR